MNFRSAGFLYCIRTVPTYTDNMKRYKRGEVKNKNKKGNKIGRIFEDRDRNHWIQQIMKGTKNNMCFDNSK